MYTNLLRNLFHFIIFLDSTKSYSLNCSSVERVWKSITERPFDAAWARYTSLVYKSSVDMSPDSMEILYSDASALIVQYDTQDWMTLRSLIPVKGSGHKIFIMDGFTKSRYVVSKTLLKELKIFNQIQYRPNDLILSYRLQGTYWKTI